MIVFFLEITLYDLKFAPDLLHSVFFCENDIFSSETFSFSEIHKNVREILEKEDGDNLKVTSAIKLFFVIK